MDTRDLCVLVIIISNLRATERSRESETVTETEQQHSTSEANDEFKPVTKCGIERISLWPWALVSSHSLFPPALWVKKMLVHNSGTRNAIHLFELWCRVLQNIDERQSVQEKCARVSVTTGGGWRCWMRWKKSFQEWEREKQMDAMTGKNKEWERERDDTSIAKGVVYFHPSAWCCFGLGPFKWSEKQQQLQEQPLSHVKAMLIRKFFHLKLFWKSFASYYKSLNSMQHL